MWVEGFVFWRLKVGIFGDVEVFVVFGLVEVFEFDVYSIDWSEDEC